MNGKLFIERIRAALGNEQKLLKIAAAADTKIRKLTEALKASKEAKP